MSASLTIELPFPPSVNSVYRAFTFVSRKTGKPTSRPIISKDGREYFLAVQRLILALKPQKFMDSRLSVTIIVHPPDKRKRDLDNLGKVTLDSLQKAGVYKDDGQIDYLEFIRSYPKKPGYVEVFISEMGLSTIQKAEGI